MATTALITIEQFERMPDGERFELVRGVLREVTPPGQEHAFLQAEIIGRLYQFLREHPVGRVYGEGGVVIRREPNTVLAPDAAFVRMDRVHSAALQRGFMQQVPDLAIEIVSPNDSTSEVVDKVKLYLSAGVAVVWVINPKQQRLMVWTGDRPMQEFSPGDIFDGGEMLAGFRLPVAELFR